jgi:hypothetical protein
MVGPAEAQVWGLYLQTIGLDARVGDSQPVHEPTRLLVVNGADAIYPQM